MSQYGNYRINGDLVSLKPIPGNKLKTPPGTTRNTAAAIAKIVAAAAGIYLIFAALVFAVSKLI